MSPETNDNTTRKAINFDIEEVPLREAIASGKTGFKSRKTAWAQVGRFLVKAGFVRGQYSGYSSQEPMTMREARRIIVNIGKAYPWLAKCMTRCMLTSIEDTFSDLTDDLRKGSKIAGKSETLAPSPTMYGVVMDPQKGKGER